MEKRIKVGDDRWTVRVVALAEMVEHTGDSNTAGLTIADQRLILINEDSVNFRVVAHELVHAYWYYLHLADTDDMTLDQIEEIMANFIPIQGEALLRKAKRLTRELQKGFKNV